MTELCDLHGRRAVGEARDAARSRPSRSSSRRSGAIDAVDDRVSAFLTPTPQLAHERAEELDVYRATGAPRRPVAGIPTALKDVLTTNGIRTTCGSRILENYVPPYDARRGPGCPATARCWSARRTATSSRWARRTRTRRSGRSTTRGTSARVPGGSSGGSAAAVAAGRGGVGARDRHGRQRPPAGVALRRGRPEAHVRPDQPVRPDRLRVLARHGRNVHPERAGRRDPARPCSAGRIRATPRAWTATARLRRRPRRRRRGPPGRRDRGSVRRGGRAGRPRGGRAPPSNGWLRSAPRSPRPHLPARGVRVVRVLPDRAERVLVEPRPLRRRALRVPGRGDARRHHRDDVRNARAGVRHRGQTARHARNVRAVGRLLRGVLRHRRRRSGR